MQLLRDNLTLWTSSEPTEGEGAAAGETKAEGEKPKAEGEKAEAEPAATEGEAAPAS
jgi:14-3-3 protein epsilon